MWLVSTSTIAGNLPIRLEPGQYQVGRTARSQIVINDPTVSRRHAELTCSRDGVLVRDLGSRNGTSLNGRRMAQGRAELGDELRFGAVRCLLAASAIGPPHAEESMTPHRVPPGSFPTVDLSGLTPAQREILDLVLEGLDEKAIAVKTGRRPGTVHTHLKAIYPHFQVHSRPELIVKIMRGRSQP